MHRETETNTERRAGSAAAEAKRMSGRAQRSLRSAALVALLTTVVAGAGTTQVRAAAPAAAHADECGTCHVAYPARLLAPSEWFAVLNALDEHYGVDATVDSAVLALVARHVGVTAGVPHPGDRPSAAAASPRELPRITRQPWFVREHRAVRVAPGEKLSQCDGCHAGAARGAFDEDELPASARGRERTGENHHERD